MRSAQRVHHQLNSLQGGRDFPHIVPPQDPVGLEPVGEERPRVSQVLLLEERPPFCGSWTRDSPTRLPPTTPRAFPPPLTTSAPAPLAGVPLSWVPSRRLASPWPLMGLPLTFLLEEGGCPEVHLGLSCLCLLSPKVIPSLPGLKLNGYPMGPESQGPHVTSGCCSSRNHRPDSGAAAPDGTAS